MSLRDSNIKAIYAAEKADFARIIAVIAERLRLNINYLYRERSCDNGSKM